MLCKVFAALSATLVLAVPAHAAGDAKAGADVFKRCAVCHTIAKGGPDGLGPNLFGVAGRKAASRPGFSYSAALQKSGLAWTDDNLTKWVAGPGRVAPGTKMMFAGITSKTQQADVVAYLDSLK
jgi:cytochrome c